MGPTKSAGGLANARMRIRHTRSDPLSIPFFAPWKSQCWAMWSSSTCTIHLHYLKPHTRCPPSPSARRPALFAPHVVDDTALQSSPAASVSVAQQRGRNVSQPWTGSECFNSTKMFRVHVQAVASTKRGPVKNSARQQRYHSFFQLVEHH